MNGGEVYHCNEEGEGQLMSRSVNGIVSVSEIEEVDNSANDLFEIDHRGVVDNSVNDGSLFSFDFHRKGDADGGDDVYVVVGNTNKMVQESSRDALLWTLDHENLSSATIFLIHVFPETKYIPTPLGMIPIGQVSAEQKEKHMAEERSKRAQFLQKLIDLCRASKVKEVDTILIESDTEAKAIVDLIPVCNIKKLILRTSKPNLKKMMSRRGNGLAAQVLQNAPETCHVKIICDGKEVVELHSFESPSPRQSNGSTSSRKPIEGQTQNQDQDQPQNQSFACGCFGPKVMH